MMKQATPQASNPNAMIPKYFGLEVIVTTDAATKIELLKPVENFTNLMVRPQILHKPNSFSVIDEGLNLAQFTELRSLRFNSISLMDCGHERTVSKLESALNAMPHLTSLSFSSVFDESDSAKAARFVFAALTKSKFKLEEFQFHFNHTETWDLGAWSLFGGVIRSVKRFSYRSQFKLSQKNEEDLRHQMSLAKDMVSCEFKVPELSKYQWNFLLRDINKAPLRVLELGTFDLTNADHLAIISEILTSFPSLKTLGLKVSNWNNWASSQLLSLIGQKGQHLNQLIIDSTSVEYNIESLKKDLLQTQLLDFRFVNGVSDCTPDAVVELCIERINTVFNTIASNKGKVSNAELVEQLEGLISRLCFDESSVSLLTHHIIGMMNNYLRVVNLDKTKQVKFEQFLAKLSQWIEAGKIPYDYIMYMFGSQQKFPDGEILLALLPSLMKACQSVQEIEENLRPHFIQCVGGRALKLRQAVPPASQKESKMGSVEVHKCFAEIRELEALLGDVKYFPLLKSVERYGYLLSLNTLKDVLSEHSGQAKGHVEKFIKSQYKEFVQSTDGETFSMFLTCTVPIVASMLASKGNRANQVIQLVLSEIKSPELLFQASNIITHIKSHIPTIHEQLWLLKISLACQRVALHRGFNDQEKCFEAGFRELQRAMQKSTTQCLPEIDSLVEELFKEKVSDFIPTFLKEQIEAERAAVPKKVPLKDLLRSKADDQDSGKKVPLKDLLRPKTTDNAPLGKFFEDQRRDQDPDSQGAGLKDGLN